MGMDHVCSPLREMKGVFSFCHCLGLRIFPGNCFRLKSAFLLGCASSSPSSGAGPGQVSVASESCVTSWARELCVCVCVCVCVYVCVYMCVPVRTYMHVCVHGNGQDMRGLYSHSFPRELEGRKFRKRRKREEKKRVVCLAVIP